MPLSFADLKKNSSSSLEKLSEQLSKINTPTFNNDDDRIWYPDVDKTGNGYAVIRFLDTPKGEDIPFVRLWKHSFQGPTGSWYIEECLSTIGKPDPVMECNNTLWNSGLESDKNIARKQKRNLYFISNILVIKDPAKPENEGKVFLFRYGKKLYDKLNDSMNPPELVAYFAKHPKATDAEAEEAVGIKKVNPFDFWTGANLKMKIRTVVDGDKKWRNYDMSAFDAPAPVADDAKIEELWNQEYPLQPFLAEKNFKTYDELKIRLDKVLRRVAKVEEPVKTNIVPLVPLDEGEEEEEDSKLTARMRLFEEMKKDSD